MAASSANRSYASYSVDISLTHQMAEIGAPFNEYGYGQFSIGSDVNLHMPIWPYNDGLALPSFSPDGEDPQTQDSGTLIESDFLNNLDEASNNLIYLRQGESYFPFGGF